MSFANSKPRNLKIFHQNIRGLRNKIDELSIRFSNCAPQVLCFTEHHLKEYEINITSINCYNLGAFYCRKAQKAGRVGIFVHNTLSYTPIDLAEYCNEQGFEACALKLKASNSVFCILCIYRPPSGNGTFLPILESLLNKLYTNSNNVIICGDINTDYLKNSNHTTKLNTLLATYNLHSIVNFPTRVTKHSSTAIDNIFMNKSININYTIESLINGLSDHDAQILILQNINIRCQKIQPIITRQINETTIAQFKLQLSEETWSTTFNEQDIELSFNTFLN
jgi:exonuclease III